MGWVTFARSLAPKTGHFYFIEIIGYRDPETRQFYVFLTNLFHLRAGEVAAIYKARWQIELFFKWVKQHLKIKSFLGTTANAVMTQVWVALCVYLLVAT